MTDTSHLSIGEVLSLLQEEFPDVTISKIRFLESQGLLDPERTPSGYRKFYEDDVERLRWILQQQRDHFLPLKVIRERLESTGGRVPEDDETEPTGTATRSRGRDEQPSRVTATAAARRGVVEGEEGARVLDGGETDLSMTADELASATGLTESEIDTLQRYGLLVTRQVGAERYFDGDAVVVARAAAAFSDFGVEPRHLRMYKVSSEREAGFFEQVVMPMLKQRNPEARQRAVETVARLAQLGQQLHSALLRQALDDTLG